MVDDGGGGAVVVIVVASGDGGMRGYRLWVDEGRRREDPAEGMMEEGVGKNESKRWRRGWLTQLGSVASYLGRQVGWLAAAAGWVGV